MLLNCGAREDSWESLRLQGDPPWIFIGRTDAGAEASKFRAPEAKSWFIGKDTDVGKDWGQEKEVTEDETVGWHHWLNGHEFEQTSEDREEQGSLPYCCPWGCKELDMRLSLNNKEQDSSLWHNSDSHCTPSSHFTLSLYCFTLCTALQSFIYTVPLPQTQQSLFPRNLSEYSHRVNK